jgi:YbgC/YbaW family acyl-CoA thioester hydrolase
METVMTIRVAESDIDELGHMSYLKYIQYVQDARRDWYEQAGFPLAKKREEEQITVVMKKFEIVYLKETVAGETLKIVTSPLRLGIKSFTLKHVIYNQKEEPVTEAESTMVGFNLSNRTGIKVPDEIARYF